MTALWRDRNFAAFLCVQTLSAFGDAFSFVAVPLLVLDTMPLTRLGWIRAAEGIATLATGVVAGAIADRYDRRTVLRLCDLARFVLLAVIPVAWASGPRPWLLFVVLPLAAVCSMVFQVTYVTVVPALVPEDRIAEANGLLYGSYAVAYLAGPAAAGLISQAAGPAAAIGVDAVTFVLSALGISLVRLRRPAAEPVERGFAAGARFIWRHPLLRTLTILLTVVIFFTSSLNDVVVYHLRHDLGQREATVGLVVMVGIVGTMLASFAVARVRRRFGFGATWIGAYTLCGAVIAGIGLASRVPVVAVLAAAVTLCTGIAGIASMSLRQEVTPGPVLGRVTSAFWTLQLTLAPLGDAALTLSAGHVGVPLTLSVAGGAVTLTALAALCTPVRRGTPRP